MSISKTHPYWLIYDIVKENDDIKNISLSRYKYTPNSVEDNREKITLERSDFLDEELVKNILINLENEENIAFHSEIKMLNNTFLHIPLIDMSTPSKAHLEKLKNYLGEDAYKEIKWYRSGRSFHGYVKKIISFDEWVRFMGNLLLCNQKNMTPTVDPRWIGHRLLAGYSALRWTKNGVYYLALPEEISSPPP